MHILLKVVACATIVHRLSSYVPARALTLSAIDNDGTDDGDDVWLVSLLEANKPNFLLHKSIYKDSKHNISQKYFITITYVSKII